ncbi:hypothetical protein ADL27_15470, partial [Streptomyces sp. NRRL F-6602]
MTSSSALRPRRPTARPGVAWTLPAVVFFTLFALVPLLLVAVLAFTDWSGLGTPHFNGLSNWHKLFDDPVLYRADLAEGWREF